MKRLIYILIAAALAMTAGCAAKPERPDVKNATAVEAMEMMKSESGYIILDVRTAEEFASGHIPGAVNIPVETIDGCPEELSKKDQLIFVYCRSGRRSKTAAEKLSELGYTNIVEFGGIIDWPGEVVK